MKGSPLHWYIARAQAVAEAVPERTGEIAALIRRALGSDAAVRARAGRALREVPTDSVPASEVERRLESYRLQAGLYVAGLEAATRRKVARVTYVFVSSGREASRGDPTALAEAALARV